MAERKEARAPSTPKRRGKQGVTRQLLIDATMELLREHGLTALTTARIAKHAGIAQPGFYAHFKSVDDCMEMVIAQITDKMRSTQGVARRDAFARFTTITDGNYFDAVRAAYADTIEVMLEEPRFAEIILRYRRDTSKIGNFIRTMMDSVRDDIVADVWRNARAMGAGAEDYAYVAFWAEEILALYMAGTEALLDGRFTDKDLIYDTLAAHTCAMMQVQSPNPRLRRTPPQR